MAPVSQAGNGICYSVMGEITPGIADLERMIAAVPRTIAAALDRKAYYFVPLTLNLGDETMIADRYDVQLSDSAVCHRNQTLGDSQCVFISTRLMEDSFAIAFEFFINIGHNFVDRVGVSQEFSDLVWKQVDDKARGETSLDAYELRKVATTMVPRPRRPSTNTCWPPSPTRSRSTCCRSISTWTIRTCASAIIRCWLPMRWLSACARSTNYSPPIPDSSLRSITGEGRKNQLSVAGCQCSVATTFLQNCHAERSIRRLCECGVEAPLSLSTSVSSVPPW